MNFVMDIEKHMNDSQSEYIKIVKAYMDACEKKHQRENPCPKCGGNNTHVEPIAICGANSSWIEWCDDCGWKKETNSGVEENTQNITVFAKIHGQRAIDSTDS